MAKKESQFDWVIISLLALFHILAAIGLFYATPQALVAFAFFYCLTVLGITVGFHRYFTHKSFKAAPWLDKTLAVMGTLALQGSLREWVAHHRMHHAGSDTPKDPHNASRGFWYSHMLWMAKIDPSYDEKTLQNRLARDIIADPFLRWLSTPLAYVGLQVVLGVLLWTFFGFEVMMWGIFVRLVAVYHVTWLVNSACHKFGYKNYDLDDLSTNLWWVALLAFGEGWHNNHHARGELAQHGHKWWEFDISWQFIKIFRLFGWIWDIKALEPEPKKPRAKTQAIALVGSE